MMKNLTDKITKDGSLDLSWEESLENVDGLANCTSITSLSLHCTALENVDGLAKLTSLTYLNLADCKKIKTKPSGGIQEPLGP